MAKQFKNAPVTLTITYADGKTDTLPFAGAKMSASDKLNAHAQGKVTQPDGSRVQVGCNFTAIKDK